MIDRDTLIQKLIDELRRQMREQMDYFNDRVDDDNLVRLPHKVALDGTVDVGRLADILLNFTDL